jgi:hypothetical protein
VRGYPPDRHNLIAEVFELERLPQIGTTDQRHHALQIVARLTGNADFITLDLRCTFSLLSLISLTIFFAIELSIPCLSLASTL